MTDKFTASSFADYIVGQRKRPVTFLDKIDKFIDWNPIEKILR